MSGVALSKQVALALSAANRFQVSKKTNL